MTTDKTHFSNADLAAIFYKIGDLLEIKGEVIYKILAYRKAGDSLMSLGRDVNEIWREGHLDDIPGVGKAIAEKIDEILSTGHLRFLDKLEAEVPPSLIELLQVPDLGPKKARRFWQELGIESLDALEAAAQAGKLRDMPGMGEKSESKILAGIASLKRRSGRATLGRAWPVAQELLAFLRGLPDVEKADMGGSLRRMRETIGDIDLVAASNNPEAVMDAFTNAPFVGHVIGSGAAKSSVELSNGLRSQLWVQPPERYGTLLQYATGSKDHSVRLREIAQKMGLSLSEQDIERSDGSRFFCATEEEVYDALGLAWMPPELREDRGEVDAARKGMLPKLIDAGDIHADLHCHSTWSDGHNTILEMARAAKAAGLKVMAITDHSGGLGITGGLNPKDMGRQRAEIEAAEREVGGIRILQGTEVEIRADGSLDYPDEVLAQFDLVIASLHAGLRQSREQVTARLLNAIRNPHVDIIGHPTGRLLGTREAADLDMEAVLKAAAESGVTLEINASPERLDLNDVYSRRAVELGALLSINSDSHHTETVGRLMYGIATARRGWVEAPSVINTWAADRLEKHFKQRGK